MSMVAWVIVGVVAGSVAGLVVAHHGILEDVIVAVVGSIIGGWLFVELTGAAVTALNPLSLPISLVGAVLFLVLARGLTQNRSTI